MAGNLLGNIGYMNNNNNKWMYYYGNGKEYSKKINKSDNEIVDNSIVDLNNNDSNDNIDNYDEIVEYNNNILYKRKNGLLICQWNVNQFTNIVRSKINYIIHTKNPDIIALKK